MNVGFRFMDGTRDWAWINKQVRLLRVEDTTGIVAVNSDTGELIGACVMDSWTKNAVQCHLTITNMMAVRHGFINRIADYVFTECDRKLIIGLVPARNEKALKLDKHIGFTVKTVFEDVFEDGSDYVIMELKRENCPYWVPNKEQEKSHGKA
jgi:hypothetical protein